MSRRHHCQREFIRYWELCQIPWLLMTSLPLKVINAVVCCIFLLKLSQRFYLMQALSLFQNMDIHSLMLFVCASLWVHIGNCTAQKCAPYFLFYMYAWQTNPSVRLRQLAACTIFGKACKVHPKVNLKNKTSSRAERDIIHNLPSYIIQQDAGTWYAEILAIYTVDDHRSKLLGKPIISMVTSRYDAKWAEHFMTTSCNGKGTMPTWCAGRAWQACWWWQAMHCTNILLDHKKNALHTVHTSPSWTALLYIQAMY